MQQTLVEMLDLTGKTAIVTGSGKGIGFGIAKRLGEAGCNVVIAERSKELMEEAVKTLKEMNYSAIGVEVDVCDETQIAEMVKKVVEVYGNIDILVNNAGIYRKCPIEEMNAKEWEALFNVNVKGSFLATSQVVKVMKKSGKGGSIVNLSSTGAFRANNVGMSHYHSTKGALLSMTYHLCAEIARYGIRINNILPGSVFPDTGSAASINNRNLEYHAKRIPLGRPGCPDDIAKAVVFLCSDLAAYVTGADLLVDGGMFRLPTYGLPEKEA